MESFYFYLFIYFKQSVFNQPKAKYLGSWMFTGRTDAEAETPILWPPDAKS